MKTNDKNPSSRRNFLVGATLGTAGAVAAVVTGKSTEQVTAEVAGAVAKPKGYHVTPHIQQYYETTKI